MADAVAFDLDLTLADTRESTATALRALSAETGRHINTAEAASRLGIPVGDELNHWFPSGEVTAAALRLRTLFLEVGVPLATPLNGAATTLERLVDDGLAVYVVTSRHPVVADALLRTMGLLDYVTETEGMAFGPGKVPVLRRLQPLAYVGDHPADMSAAVAAGVSGIGVTTGNHDSAALTAAGAACVVPALDALPLLRG